MTAKTKIANCAVLDTDNDSHVVRQSPLDTKRKELREADTDENPVRLREVNRRRQDTNDLRPL